MLPAQVDDHAVDLHHGHGIHRVAQRLTQRPTVAAADDQHAFGAPMGQQRHMGDHLMIDELVPGGELHDTVQRQHTPEHPVVEDDQVLDVGLLSKQ